MRDREAQLRTRPAREDAQVEARRLRRAAAREAEGEAHLRRARDQFRRYFEQAERTRGITGETLLQLLERRLDNVAYRLGFATSRPQARQLVRHGHFTVNGRKVDIPSFSVKPGDVVMLRQGSRTNPSVLHALEEVKGRGVPEWLQFDAAGMSAKISSIPTREQINLPVQEQLIVELYSK
jgi:small subunit ribosomal protein S4